MTTMTRPADAVPVYERVVGCYGGASPGPAVVCVAGVHGNEPAGIRALERVFDLLRSTRPAFRGDLVGLAGNLKALRTGRRFLDEDLNRAWSEARLNAARGMQPAERNCEEQEILALSDALEEALADKQRETYFVDLHTTSSDSAPFSVLGDTLRNRRFAEKFPVPIVLGLEEQIDGSIDEFMSRRGHVTFAFEAGRHDDPRSVDLHAAAVLTALVAAGCFEPDAFPEVAAAHRTLEEAARGIPAVLEIRHRHAVGPEDGFEMTPGYRNFQRVRRGERLATDRSGAIFAPLRGRVLMPLYQDQGSDGFFIARRVCRFWLRISEFLRERRADRIVHWLPGVARHPERPEALVVDRRIARWFTYEIFHLLGYRRERTEGTRAVVSRRPHDRP